MNLEKCPDSKELINLIGESLYNVWIDLNKSISEKYDMDCTWNTGGKAWTYEYKYRRGGKTLSSLYIKKDCIGLLIILGKKEREKFESEKKTYSDITQKLYEVTKTYHDGKWMMFEVKDISLINDYLRLLEIKRRPSKK